MAEDTKKRLERLRQEVRQEAEMSEESSDRVEQLRAGQQTAPVQETQRQQDTRAAQQSGALFPAREDDTPLEAGAKAIGNVPSSMFNVARGVFGAVTNPVETVRGIRGTLQGAGRTLGENIGTVEDTDVDTTEEQQFDAMVNALKDRYGSLENLQRTATNDPFGFGADILGLVSGGAGVAGRASQFRQLNAIPESARQSASQRLRQSAAGDIESTLRPTKQKRKVQAERISPELAERRFRGVSLESLDQQARNNLENANARLQDALEDVPDETMVKTAPILEEIEQRKQRFVVEGEDGQAVIAEPQAYQAATELQSTIAELGDNASFQSLRRIRQIWDDAVDRTGGFQKSLDEAQRLDIKKDATNAIRRELGKARPDIDRINKEFALWKTTHDVLQDTMQRKTGQSGLFRQAIGGAFGGTVGSKIGASLGEPISGFIIGAEAGRRMAGVFDSPAWKTVKASQKQKLADAIVSGDEARINEILGTIIAEQGIELTNQEENQDR